MISFEIFCGIIVVLVVVYYYFTSTFYFWKSRGIRGPQPLPGFGTFDKDVVFVKKNLVNYLMEVYNDYKNEPMIGIFAKSKPVLILKDPELIKDVLIKDFITFADRGEASHEKVCVNILLSHTIHTIYI